jgi:acetolactate synthase-1/2/3 large subunit
VLVTGDGAIGFHPLELHAAARAGLNLVVVVANDGAWGTELHTQRQAIGRDLNTQLGQLPYEQLATIVGGCALRIDSAAQLEPVLDRAFDTPGLIVVNALVDPQAGAELKTNPDVRMIVFSDLAAGAAALR